MKISMRALLGLVLVTVPHYALAESSARQPVAATPIGSPGAWVVANDYPAVALRYEMVGVTGFVLAIDTSGKPSRCDIVQSSGFDVLDEATCNRLMANARFTPAQDPTGKAVVGTYSNRVRWTLPGSVNEPRGEMFESLNLNIDQNNKVVSCKHMQYITAPGTEEKVDPCHNQSEFLSQEQIKSIRGDQSGTLIVVSQNALVFTSGLRERVLSFLPGYVRRSMSIFRVVLNREGAVSQCSYEEQRGTAALAWNLCETMRNERFDPPFSAFDKDGNATGWAINRILLKTD